MGTHQLKPRSTAEELTMGNYLTETDLSRLDEGLFEDAAEHTLLRLLRVYRRSVDAQAAIGHLLRAMGKKNTHIHTHAVNGMKKKSFF